MTGLLLDTPPLDVFQHMALDEMLARSGTADVFLRFYRWTGPAATFGYAQRWVQVAPLLPAVIGTAVSRRPTGGGVVLHLEDLTFSLIWPMAKLRSPAEIYRRLHGAILSSLKAAGLAVELAGRENQDSGTAKAPALSCFEHPVADDILGDTGKILGGALRRYQGTVLYQGSFQWSGVRAQPDKWEALLASALAAEWNLHWRQTTLSPEQMAHVERGADHFRSEAWIRRF